MSSSQTVLFIFTSADKLLDGKPTGWYLPEAAHPYEVLSPHFNIEAASPKGGIAPIDQNSVKMFTDAVSVKFNTGDEAAKKLVNETKKISDVKAKDYAAVFCVGGHGPMIDLAADTAFATLVEDFYAQGKPVSAVCHGPAALILANKPGTSQSILHGIEATGFTNDEEAQTPYNDFVNILPFSLEDKMVERGAEFVKAEAWAVKVVWDGGVLTGQNPASAGPLADRLKDILLSKV